MKRLAKKLSQAFSCPPTITPTPVCEVEKPIFTEEEFESLAEEMAELSDHLAEIIDLAIQVRNIGKFTKKDNDLLNKFDEAVDKYR